MSGAVCPNCDKGFLNISGGGFVNDKTRVGWTIACPRCGFLHIPQWNLNFKNQNEVDQAKNRELERKAYNELRKLGDLVEIRNGLKAILCDYMKDPENFLIEMDEKIRKHYIFADETVSDRVGEVLDLADEIRKRSRG